MNEQLSIRTQHSTVRQSAASAAGASASRSLEQRHQHVVALLGQQLPIRQIAAATGYSVYWVRVLAGRYAAADPRMGVDRRKHSVGATAMLSTAQQHELAQTLQASPPDGGRWTGPKVAQWMAARTGQHVHRQRGWEYLRRLGATKLPKKG